MAVSVKEKDHIKDKAGNEYRVLSLFSDMSCLCKINSTKLELLYIPVAQIVDKLNDGSYVILKDEGPKIVDKSIMSEPLLKEFQLRKAFVDEIVHEYAPLYTDLTNKRRKPTIEKYLTIKDETGKPSFSRAKLWRILRVYLQSGMTDASLMDQRAEANAHKKYNWKTNPGKKIDCWCRDESPHR